MKVAIYSRVFDQSQLLALQLFFEALHGQQLVPIIYAPFYQQIREAVRLPENVITFNSSEELNEEIECIVSLGGDGTLLDTITLIRDKKIAVMGINFGRLGFLASIGKEEVEGAVKAIAQHSCVEDRRTLIHLDANIPLFGDTPYALNEFTLLKRDVNSMIKIHTYLNGEFLNTYWADGLIVATPTGSTGYSLSCNGPIVFPESQSFVITPVAPHNLNVRPLVVPDDQVISFGIESRGDQVICSLDARREIVHKDVQLAVRKESFTVKLLRLSDNNFLHTLHNKLTWGLDKRN